MTVTANGNDADSPNKSVTVSGTAAGGNGVANPSDVTLTLEDDDALPTVSLVLSDSSVSEEGGVSTVTARLSGPSSGAVTVTVAAAAGTGAVAADFTLSTKRTLTIAAGATASTGAVTVTANGDTTDSPGKSVTVSGTAAGGNGVAAPSDVTLTLEDDDALPTASLVLTPRRVLETGGVSTVTATLSHPSSEAVTVTVAAAAGTRAVAADFTLSTKRTLTIAAGATASAGAVTVTANRNTMDPSDKSVTVSGTAAGGNGVADPPDATLTLADDEAPPTVSLVLTPGSISENGGVSTVTAALSWASSEAVTVAVAATRGDDLSLSAKRTLTVAAGSTTSAGTVTVTARDNDVDAPDGSVRVRGRAWGGNGVTDPSFVTLTLEDDDTTGISVSSATSTTSRLRTTESAGTATFTVKLDSRPTGNVVLDAASSDTDEGRVSPLFLIFTPSNWNTARTVTLIGTDDLTADGSQNYTVTLTVDRTETRDSNYAALSALTVYARNLDDEVGLDVSEVSGRATEAGGTATFRVALNTELDTIGSRAVTVTVSGRDGGEGTVSPSTLTFAPPLDRYAAKAVTVTGVQDIIDDGTVTWAVRLDPSSDDRRYARLSNVDVSVSTADDDGPPGVVLSLNPASVSENGGVSTVTARLSHPSGAATTLTVVPVAGAYTVGAGAGATIVIAAGATTGTDTALVTGTDNATDAPDRTATVTATVANDRAAADSTTMAVTGATLTLTDDDARPTVSLVLTPNSVPEDGGVSTVTAALSGASSEAVTVAVAATRGGGLSLSAKRTLTIAAGSTTSAGTVTVTARDNDVDAPDGSVRVWGRAWGGNGVTDPSFVTLTLEDDDTAGISVSPTTSTTSRLRTTESAGTATFTVKLDSRPTGNVVLGAASSDTDEGTVSPPVLTFTPSDWSDARTVTLIGADDSPPVADGSRSYTVTLTANRTNTADARYGTLSALTVYASNTDNDYGRLDVGEVGGRATEEGGTATFAVALRTRPSAAVTVTVSGRDGGEGTVSPPSLTFAPSAWDTARTVTVTGKDDDIDDGTVIWTVRLDPSSGDTDYAGAAHTDVSVSTTDDDGPPEVVLSLNPTGVSESGAGNVSTVTARLSHPSSAATTVTVAPVAGAYAAGADATIVIAAGATADAFDTATVAAVDNTTDEPDRTPTVMATVANDRAAADSTTMAVTGAELTLTDDDAAPTAELSLDPDTVSENGGVSTVTAVLSHPSSEPSTVTVTAVAGLYTVGTDATIVIAAGSTTAASDTATVIAVDNDIHHDSAGRSATVTATLANGQGAGAVTGASLTLVEDNETLPTVALVLSPASVSETGGRSTVTATLTGKSSEAVTVTVAAAAGTGAVAADFAQSGTTLTIAAGATASTGTVTVTANGNDVEAPDKSVTVSGTATGGNGVASPSAVTLTLEDDDALPLVSLVLTPSSITETGGVSTVTARLSGPSSGPVWVTVSAEPWSGAGSVAADFALSAARTLTIAAGATTSTGTVTVTANGNDVDAPDKRVVVSGLSAGRTRYGGATVALTLRDDDRAGISVSPMASRFGPPARIRLVTTESGGTATFAVELDSEPTGNVVLDVASSDTDEGTAAPSALTFTPSDWDEAQTVTLTGVDDDTATPPNPADGGQDYAATLTVNQADTQDSIYDGRRTVYVNARNRDNDYGLDVGAVSGSATEAGGTATFAVALWTQPSAAVTVAVTGRDGSEGTVAPPSLTFVPSAWNTAQTVTVTGVQDTIDDGTVPWAVRLDSSSGDAGYDGLDNEDVPVSTTDDDGPPGVALSLNPASVSENGGTATVTARLSRPSSAATTLTVTPVSGAYTAGVGGVARIVIAAGATTGTDTVLVTGTDNATDAPDRTETVTATVTNARAAADSTTMAVTGATLTLTDDDAAPTAALSLDPETVSEARGVSMVTATLSHPSSEPSTVTVTAVVGLYTVGTDATIVIAAGSTTAASDTATVIAVDNDIHHDSAGRSATVSATLANGQGAGAVTGASLTLMDNETLPTVSLVLSPASISETGGVSTVTARLLGASSAAVTVTVAAVAGPGAVAADFTRSGATLTIAAGATASTGTVTVTANGNDVGSPDKSVTVSGTAAGGNGVSDPADVTLTLEDDDPPTVSLVLSDPSISETGGVSTVTARLSGAWSAAVTVTVAAAAGTGSTAGDFTRSGTTLTIAAGATASTGTVTVRANGNDVDSPDKSVMVSGTAAGGNGVADPSDVTLTLEDDEALPTVSLVLAPTSITETNGVATVTATLAGRSSEAVTVTVGAAVSGDFALSTATTLTIAAGSTASTGTVTVTAEPNDVDAADRSATVSGTAAGGNGVADPSGVTLILTDDDTAGVAVSPSTSATSRLVTTESGGTATFAVELDSEPTGNVVLGVASSDTDEGTAAPSALTFTPSDWDEAQTVTLTGTDDSPPAADGSRNYAATLTVNQADTRDSTYDGLSALTVYARNRDNEFGLDVGAVSGQATEAGGKATFAVALLARPSAAVTVTVSGRDGSEGTVAPPSLIFAPSGWNTAQTVTVTGKDDNVDDGTVTWAVRLDPSSGDTGYNGLDGEDVSVDTTDDDGPPGVVLSLSPASVSENGGISTVTATLLRPSSAATTLTVAAVAGAYTAGADATIVIAAGATAGTDTAVVTAVDNTTDEPDRTPTVTATVANDRAAADSTAMAVTGAVLTLTDDDAAPTAKLALSPATVSENGGVSTVTAALSHPSSEPSTVTVTAVAGLYTVGSDATIVIAAGSTTATADTATVTAVDDDIHQGSAGRLGTVTATLANGQGAGAVTGATLTLTDGETLPTVWLVLSPASVSELGGVSTVTALLSGPSSGAVTVTVAAAAGRWTVASDFAQVGTTLTIAAGATASTGAVTVTTYDNDVSRYSPGKSVTVSGTAAGGNGIADPPDLFLHLGDYNAVPTVSLVLSPGAIPETGGVSTVTATLSHPSGRAVTVTVSASGRSSAGSGWIDTVAADFDLSAANTLTIAAGARTSTGTVTVTANGNDVNDARGKRVTVSGRSTDGFVGPSDVILYLTDDDTVGISVSPATWSTLGSSTGRLTTTESGGTATFTAELDSEPRGNVVIGVASSDTDEGTVSPSVLTFTPSDWGTAQTVTLTGVDDSPPAADGSRNYTVTLTAHRTDTQDGLYRALLVTGHSALTVYARNRDNDYGLDVGVVSGQATEAGARRRSRWRC